MRDYKGELSPNQYRIFKYLKDFTSRHSYSPTVREICKAVGLTSTSTVHGHLTRLERKGFIKRGEGMSRAIEVLDEDHKARERSLAVPLLNDIPTDVPMYTEDNIITFLPVPKYIIPDEDSFALKVKKDSTANAGINNGDVIIVKEQDYAFDNDVVVALVSEDEKSVLIKTYYLDGKNIRLQSENGSKNALILPNNQVKIIGKVTALIRRF